MHRHTPSETPASLPLADQHRRYQRNGMVLHRKMAKKNDPTTAD